MGHVLAFAMQKGGVGKTTTTLSLGTLLASRGRRVLLIDLDPQANLTQGLGVDPAQLDYSVYEVLLNPERGVEFALCKTPAGVDLIPSSLDLAGAELELAGKVGRELLLRRALRGARTHYDYILLDPPPSLGIFSLNALTAADALLVPLQLHSYALRALPQLETTVELVREINPSLVIGGIICTLADRRTNLSQQIEAEVRSRYGAIVFHTTIPINVKLAEAPTFGTPIHHYAPQSSGALAYAALADELVARYP